MGNLSWCWPFIHCLDLVVHHAHSVATDDVTEEFDLITKQLALALLRVQLLVTEDLHYLAHVFDVLGQGSTVDENIIEEDDHELVEVIAERLMHEMHERRRCIREAEREY